MKTFHKILSMLGCIAILSVAGYAQDFPEAPAQQTPKTFWMMTGVYTASIIADGETTVHQVSQGCVEVRSPMLYGSQPTRARFYLGSALVDGGAILVSRRLVRSQSKFMRTMGWSLMSFGAEQHAYGAIANSQASCR
ncbi:MAG TPA: hypothetical protein VGF44_12585 [Terriglobales bacterium]|jgi:hypothetical protein